jgi:hypothetical protein
MRVIVAAAAFLRAIAPWAAVVMIALVILGYIELRESQTPPDGAVCKIVGDHTECRITGDRMFITIKDQDQEPSR